MARQVEAHSMVSDAMNCPQCRQVLRETARFCDGCGCAVTAHNTPTELMNSDEVASALAHTLAGRVLDGKYELTARLGAGGMGAVYRARRVHIGDEVAVKVLHPQFVADAQAVERFRREARAAAVLRHPNVVTIHDFGEARGDEAPAYIVMELVEGVSLRELLQREARLPAARAVSLMQDVCAGVGAAHRRQIVHRDLKPDNIIVLPPETDGARETAKVVDFGIAKLRDLSAGSALTAAGTLIGTPYYMSPEQCRGEPLDARSDVYSLGAMLYEMLAGSPPFNAESVTGVVIKHMTEPPAPLSDVPGVPPALSAVCLRALAKNASDRQPDATTLARELQAALTTPAAADTSPAVVAAAPLVAAPTPDTTPTQLSIPTVPRPAPPSAQAAQAERRPGRAKWLVGGVLTLLGVCVVVTAAAIIMQFAAGKQTADAPNTPPANVSIAQPAVPASNKSDAEVDASPAVERSSSADDKAAAPPAWAKDFTGDWTGTYGPMNQPATLHVRQVMWTTERTDFKGVLEQGGVQVACEGIVANATRRVTFKETRVLKGDGWSLGEGTGTLSPAGRTMSGTGQDPTGAQLGISYQWSFTKHSDTLRSLEAR
jgi:serine/threonine-protein kinase